MKRKHNNLINVILIITLLFLIYNILNKKSQKIIVKEKIIYKKINKESHEDPYRDHSYIPDNKRARNYPPFNIKTRGPPQEYDMVGFLQDPEDSSKLQQLYGRKTYPNSNNWNYFVKSDQYHQIPIPVSLDGQNCTEERGCKELQDKSSIKLFDKEHTATIYKPEPYYYNPHII